MVLQQFHKIADGKDAVPVRKFAAAGSRAFNCLPARVGGPDDRVDRVDQPNWPQHNVVVCQLRLSPGAEYDADIDQDTQQGLPVAFRNAAAIAELQVPGCVQIVIPLRLPLQVVPEPEPGQGIFVNVVLRSRIDLTDEILNRFLRGIHHVQGEITVFVGKLQTGAVGEAFPQLVEVEAVPVFLTVHQQQNAARSSAPGTPVLREVPDAVEPVDGPALAETVVKLAGVRDDHVDRAFGQKAAVHGAQDLLAAKVPEVDADAVRVASVAHASVRVEGRRPDLDARGLPDAGQRAVPADAADRGGFSDGPVSQENDLALPQRSGVPAEALQDILPGHPLPNGVQDQRIGQPDVIQPDHQPVPFGRTVH